MKYDFSGLEEFELSDYNFDGIETEEVTPEEGPSMEARNPGIISRALDSLFPPNPAAASNELAAREIAQEQGLKVDDVYEQAGGARPMGDPMGRSGFNAITDGYTAARVRSDQAEAQQVDQGQSYLTRVGQAAGHGWDNMVGSLELGKYVLGGGDPRDMAALISQRIDAGQHGAQMRKPDEAGIYGTFDAVSDADGTLATIGSSVRALGEFFTNPDDATAITAEQFANSVPAIGLGGAGAVGGGAIGGVPGAIIGGRTGMATGSVAVEFGAEIQEAITEKLGQNINSPYRAQLIEEYLSDESFMSELKARGLKKGLTVAAVDQAFLSISGRIAAGPMMEGAEATAMQKAKAGAAGVATDMVGEGLGEGTSQLVARGEVEAGDVLLEAAASGPSAIIETGAGAAMEIAKNRMRQNSPVDTGMPEEPAPVESAPDEVPTLQPEQNVSYDFDIEDALEEAEQQDTAKTTYQRQNEAMRQTKTEDSEFLKRLDEKYDDKPATKIVATETESRTGIHRVNVDDIQVDPEQYQFRSKVNEEGVDNRLDGIDKWDDTRSGVVMLHRRKDGSIYVADGHHRVNLAKRLGQKEINARFVDESEGVGVAQARTEAAMNNIADGKAEAVDIAKVVRDTGMTAKELRETQNLPNSQLVRDGAALAELSDNVFGLVVSGQLDHKDGAAIGGGLQPEQHDAAADVFLKVKPETAHQRAMLVNEIKAAGFAETQGEQGGLFGDDPQEISLMQHRLKVLDKLRTRLNTDKRLFKSLNDNADRAQEAGNVIATDQNEEISALSKSSLDLLNRVATTPDLNEMVNRAAKRVYDGESISTVAKELQQELSSYERPQRIEENGEQQRPDPSSEPADTVGDDAGAGERLPEQNADGADNQGQPSPRSEEEVTPQDDLLSDYSEDELKAQAEERERKEAEEAKARQEEENRIKADEQVDDFALTGSDRPADANPNQNDMFGNTPVESRTDQEKPAIQVKRKEELESDLIDLFLQDIGKYRNEQDIRARINSFFQTMEATEFVTSLPAYQQRRTDGESYKRQKEQWDSVDQENIIGFVEQRVLGKKLSAPTKKPRKKAKTPAKKRVDRIARIENYFRPGRVVPSYGGTFDKVIEFNKGDNQKWSVTVAEVNEDGSEKGPVRSHSTQPSERELKAWEKDNPVPDGSQKPQVSANKVFTDDAADKARALLKAKLGQMNSGLDPEILQAGITLAGYHIEKGARTFAAYAKAMVDDMGDSVKPYLKSWYVAVRFDPRASEFANDMDTAASVEQADVDQSLSEVGENDAERATGNTNTGSEGNAEPSAQSDLRDEERGSERPGTDEAGETTSEAEQRPSDAVGSSSAVADREPSDQSVYDDESRVESSDAGSADDTGSLPDSTGGLFADLETSAETQQLIEQTPDEQPKLGKRPLKKTSIEAGNAEQIKSRMPFLTEGQIEDVAKAEVRHSQPDGYGMLFTNGTGTGKTFTGLGVARRSIDQGKSNILIVAPKQTIADAWIKAGANFFDIGVSRLENTNDAGKGVVVTTYANIGDNDAVVSRDWDLVIADESHYLSSDKEGTTTKALRKLRALTLKTGSAQDRVYAQNSEMVTEMRALYAEAKSLRESGDQRDWQAEPAVTKKARAIGDKLRELTKAEKERMDALKPEDKPRAVFLSATPFAYDKNVIIGQEFLFDWGSDKDGAGSLGYNAADNYQQFMIQHFGYRMRTNKLTQPDAKVDNTLMERAFNAWLKKEGVLSGRTLDSAFDYDRRFILAENAIGRRVDDALEWLRDTDNDSEGMTDGKRELQDKMIGENFNYHARMYFLEAIKAREAIPYIKDYIAAGRKVVVMHDFKQGGTKNPFVLQLSAAESSEMRDAYRAFREEFADLINSFSSLPSPTTVLKSEFPEALIYNGNFTAKQRIEMQDEFNSDAEDSPRLIVAQGDAMREGVSIHDTTGKFQRVMIHLGMPVKPTASIQQEGRIYRTGQASDAIFRYFTIGSNWERYAFASTISQRAGTAENLAMGELARGLKDSFIEAYEDAGNYPPGMEGEGKGGKARDRVLADALTPWDMAKSYYYGTKKQGKGRSSRGREGADYFATPEPIGLKMVQWADIRGGESVLEPSAGHGAIGRWFPDNTKNRAIEQSGELASRLSLRFGGDVVTGDFESHNLVNKYDVIVMNPPYGHGGKTAADHVRKAMKHLRDGGRIVALIPTGPAADKQFDKLLYPDDPSKDTDAKDIYVAGEIILPRVTFDRAGTSVSTRILILEKQTNPELVTEIQQQNRDYSNAETIEELFDRIEDVEIRPRSKRDEDEATDTDAPADDKPVPEGEYELSAMDSKHTKSGKDLFVVNMLGDMGENYERLNQLAKKHGGYYIRAKLRSYYKPNDGGKPNGKPTFTFDSADERAAFMSEANPLSFEEAQLSAGTGKAYNNVSKDELSAMVGAFQRDYNGNVPLEFIIVDKQEEVYGPDATPERTGKRVAAAYHAKAGKVVLVASSFRNVSAAREAIKHEVLGHYGLNTFSPAAKEAFLRKVLETRKSLAYRGAWKEIDRLYEGESDLAKAEEMFAYTIEKGDSLLRRLLDFMADTISRLLRAIGLQPETMTRTEMRNVAASIAQGIRNGTREQQTFPQSDNAQFSQEPANERESRMKKFMDGIGHQPIDRMFRLPFDVAGLVDSHGRLKGSVEITKKAEYAIKEWTPHEPDQFNWMDNMLETARHGLIDRYKLTDEYKTTFREAEALGRRLDSQALDILQTLEERGVDAKEAAVLQNMLTGEQIPDGQLNQLAAPILRAIDDLGLMAVEYGIITREQFERNRGAYLHRSYLKHEGEFTGLGKFLMNHVSKRARKIKGDSAKGRGIEIKLEMDRLLKHVPQDWYGIKKVSKKPDLNALNGMKFVVLDNPGMDPRYSETMEGMQPNERERIVERIYWPADMPMPARFEGYRNRGTYEVRGKRNGKVVIWRDYTKAERQNMGEIVDARYNIAKTFQVISHDIAMGKFFQDISRNDNWFQRDLPSDAAVLSASEARSLRNLSKTDWVHVPDTVVKQSAGTKQWGALAGGYVRAEIWRDLNELDKMHNPGTWRKILTQWKLNKTARSPVVHMNNVMSNMMLMDLADVRMTDLIAGIRSYKERDEHRQAAEEYGAFEGTFANEELRRQVMEPILDELAKQSMDASSDAEGMAGGLSKMAVAVWKGLKRADRAMVEAYQVEDELFRMATYMRRISLGDTPQEAAQIAREQFLDYDIRAPWINAARRSVLPFISYTYRAVPVLAQAITERPWKLAKYVTLAHIAGTLAYALSPGDEDEERRTMREDQQGLTWMGTPRMQRMPWRDEHGNPVFMDIRRWIPAGDVFDMNQGNSALPIPAWLQFGGPLMIAGEFVLNKQAFTGREITSESDTGFEATGKVADWLYKSWMPSAAYIPGSYYWEKMGTAWSGGRDILGRPYSFTQAMLSSIGIKVQPHDVKLGYTFRSRDLAAEARLISGDIRRAESDLRRNIISKAEYNKIISRSRKKFMLLKEKQDKLRGRE